jgi:1-deoxy-D-xylulose-5-phosphate reductoisomerase
MAQSLSILGATGSIGRSSSDVVLAHRDEVRVESVDGGRNAIHPVWSMGSKIDIDAVTAGSALPDMADELHELVGLAPIPDALRHRECVRMDPPRLDLAAIGRLSFERPDEARFPCVSLAEATLEAGKSMPTILNAANEIAAEAHMADRFGFYHISELVEQVFSTLSARTTAAPAAVEEALAIDREAWQEAQAFVPAYAEAARL